MRTGELSKSVTFVFVGGNDGWSAIRTRSKETEGKLRTRRLNVVAPVIHRQETFEEAWRLAHEEDIGLPEDWTNGGILVCY